MKTYLEFEKDIKDLEEELEKLKDPFNKEGLSEVETDKISTIQNQIDEKLKISYANLNEWQKTQVARHEERPKAKFVIFIKGEYGIKAFIKVIKFMISYDLRH